MSRMRWVLTAAVFAVVVGINAMPVFAAAPDISAYTTALDDVIGAVLAAIPTILVTIGGPLAGLMAVRIGIRMARGFLK